MVHPSVCLLVDDFSFYFTPLTGVLFTFPSRYLFTIGGKEYLALAGGPAEFLRAFTYPVVLRNPARRSPVSVTGLSPSAAALSRTFSYL